MSWFFLDWFKGLFAFIMKWTAPISMLYGSGFVLTKLPKLIFKPSSFHLQPRTNRPSLLRDPSLGSHAFFQVPNKNITLHYVTAGDQSKQLMLFVHGFPDCWLSWRSQMLEFAKDYWVVALDLRGYGESDKPEGTAHYTMDEISSDIKDLIAHLGQKPVLVSHDFGGAASWHLLRQDSSQALRHIAINSPDGRFFSKVLKSSWKQFLKSWYMFFFNCPRLPEMALSENDMAYLDIIYRKIATKEEIECLKYYFSQPGAWTSALNYYRAIFERIELRAKAGPKITTPTFVIWGMDDIALTPVIGSGVTSFVDRVEIKQLHGVGHWAHQERPQEVNQLIRNYLERELK